MSGFFLQIVNWSISASYLILAVLALRLILRSIPKNLLIWLWALVAVRLALPFSLESALSLIPRRQPIPADIALAPAPAIDSGVSVIDRTVNPVIVENLTPDVTASVNPMQVLLTVISVVWLVGVAAMLLYAAVSYLRLSRQVRVSLRLRGNLYLCDGIPTPFILGILKPKIYLPSDMKPEHQSYVLKHERAHLHHHDNLWKPLGFLLLSVHWFNPLVWIAYLLFCRDLEMACDERAIADLPEGARKAYSYALLSCAAPKHSLAVCPVAFGENSVKSRIKNVLHFKKASFWVIAVVVVITVIAAVCFLTNPKEEPEEAVTEAGSTETAPPVETTAPKADAFEPLDGSYTYTNGNLQLEFGKVSGVRTQMVQDEHGVEYEQTILLTEPGIVVTIVDPDMRDGTEGWRICETTGTLAPIPLTDGERSRHLVLSNNEYYIEDVDSDSHKVLLLQPKVEDIADYVPATAKSAVAYDLTTTKLLYPELLYTKTATGDLNKFALALVVLQNHSPEELVDTTGLPAYLKDGESYRQSFPFAKPELSLERMQKMTVEDLLILMLLRGGDDAAYALARFDAGSEEAMVAKMNDYVKAACKDTNYTDLYGYGENQYTTGMDTLILLRQMLFDPCLSEIWSTRAYTFHFPDSEEEYTVQTTNYLFDNFTIPEFYDVRVTGGFAYYRGTANIVCTARLEDGREILFILLGAQRRFMDNGWQVGYYGNYEEMGELINAVFASMQSKPDQLAN